MKSAQQWFGRKVLITGADGFLASHMTQRLMELGAVVTVVARHQRPFTTLSLLTSSKELPDVEISDLSDFVEVQKICNRHQIDTIFHLAASAVVSNAANAPMSTLQNNIGPTLNLLETARINRIPRTLIASTDKSYGDHADADDPEPLPYRETHALRGLDVYSASKACADLIAQTYAFQYQMPVAVIRSSNIYGPGDLNFTRLIPRTTLRLMSGKSPVINLGNENVLREYVHVTDVVEAYLNLADHLDKSNFASAPRSGRATYGWSAYNVGSYSKSEGDPRAFPSIRSVVQVIDMIQSLLKTTITPQIIPKPDNFIEIPDQFLDSAKLMQLGFKPGISFADGLAQTVEWYRKNLQLLGKFAHNYVK